MALLREKGGEESYFTGPEIYHTDKESILLIVTVFDFRLKILQLYSSISCQIVQKPTLNIKTHFD